MSVPAAVDPFAVLADPTRRRILTALTAGERSVGELAGALRLSQPTASKHLKVLRDNGFVASRTDAQRRMYHVEPGPLAPVDAWLQPFRDLWTTHLDALERHLDASVHAPSPGLETT